MLVREDGMIKRFPPIGTSCKNYWHTGRPDKDGYRRNKIPLTRKDFRIHVAVCLAFCEGVPTGVVDHIDGIRDNNVPRNLRWTTVKGNSRNGLYHRSGKLLGTTLRPNGKWRAQVYIRNKAIVETICVGEYDTMGKAHEAYCNYKTQHGII